MFNIVNRIKSHFSKQVSETPERVFLKAMTSKVKELSEENKAMYAWVDTLQSELKQTRAILFDEIKKRKAESRKIGSIAVSESPKVVPAIVDEEGLLTCVEFLQKIGITSDERKARGLSRRASFFCSATGAKHGRKYYPGNEGTKLGRGYANAYPEEVLEKVYRESVKHEATPA